MKDTSRQSTGNKRPGRYNPTYHPSGKGTYNCRWRKEERREAAVARQKALYDSDRLVKKPAGHEAVPIDWRIMLPASKREESGGRSE